MGPIITSGVRFLGEFLGKNSSAMISGMAKGAGSAAKARITSLLTTMRNKVASSGVFKINPGNYKALLTRVAPVLNVAGLGSMLYAVTEGFSTSKFSPDQLSTLRVAAENLVRSDLYRDFSRSFVQVASTHFASDADLKTAIENSYQLLVSSDVDLEEFSKTLTNMTPLQKCFALCLLLPKNTGEHLNRLVETVNKDQQLILSQLLSLFAISNIVDVSSEEDSNHAVESSLFNNREIAFQAESTPVCYPQVALREDDIDNIRRLEMLTGLKGVTSRGPALAELLKLLSAVKSEQVEKYYELRELVQ